MENGYVPASDVFVRLPRSADHDSGSHDAGSTDYDSRLHAVCGKATPASGNVPVRLCDDSRSADAAYDNGARDHDYDLHVPGAVPAAEEQPATAVATNVVPAAEPAVAAV